MLVAGTLVLLLVSSVLIVVLSRPDSRGTELRYDEFRDAVRANQIEDATIRVVDKRIVGTYGNGAYWVAYGNDGDAIFNRYLDVLDRARIPVTVDQQPLKSLLTPLGAAVPSLALVDAIILGILLSRGSAGARGFARARSQGVPGEEARITFADVAGVEETAEELAEIRDFLASPDHFAAMGARIPRGILLVGPPGCGKTLLARAVAGESGVPFFSLSGSDFVEMFVGVGAARIRDLFREARSAAPAIIFIDELDAVGRGRSAGSVSGQDEREATLNQLLVGLDGFERDAGVVVLAATNRPDVLDPALLRPGRFDRRIFVDLPDVAGRLGILEVHARGKPMATGIDLRILARRCAGFSGADLASVVNEAALLAARRRERHITQPLLSEAAERVMAGPERRSKVLSARDKELLAYHEAGHAIVSASHNPSDRVTKVSIVARGRMGGFTWFVPEEESQTSTKEQLEAQMATLMGGRAGEELGPGRRTSGSRHDLGRATDIARRMVCELGMSERLGPVSLVRFGCGMAVDPEGPSRHSAEVDAAIDAEIRRLLDEANARARRSLEKHRLVLDRLARRLQEVESIEGDELDRILYPAVGLAISS